MPHDPDDTRPPSPPDAECRNCRHATETARLRAALEARDAFIGAVVHELRSPMAPIYGQIELLEGEALRDGGSPQLILGMAKLRASVDNYMRRAAMLIETTRIASGRRRLHTELLDLSELVASVVDIYCAAAARSRTPLQTSFESGIIGQWDAIGIEQIVDNLMSNALKYGSGSLVSVSLTQAFGRARLIVTDRGPGILPEDQQTIFSPFEQMATGAARRGGFGIGLWVVRELVEAMGGSVTLETAPGRGATFIISLPIRRQSD